MGSLWFGFRSDLCRPGRTDIHHVGYRCLRYERRRSDGGRPLGWLCSHLDGVGNNPAHRWASHGVGHPVFCFTRPIRSRFSGLHVWATNVVHQIYRYRIYPLRGGVWHPHIGGRDLYCIVHYLWSHIDQNRCRTDVYRSFHRPHRPPHWWTCQSIRGGECFSWNCIWFSGCQCGDHRLLHHSADEKARLPCKICSCR